MAGFPTASCKSPSPWRSRGRRGWRCEQGLAALSTLAVLLVFLLTLAVLADYGLRDWIDPGNHILDHLSFRLLALIPIYGVAGWALERQDRAWFARPSFVAAALTLVLAVDLLAQDGKLFYHLGIGLDRLQPAKVDPVILPTYMALSLNGVLFYAAAEFFERYGTVAMTPAATFLFIIAPFSMLEPLAYLSETRRLRRPVRLVLPRPGGRDRGHQPCAAAQELLLRRPAQLRSRAVPHRRTLRVVRQPGVGHVRSWQSVWPGSSPDTCSTPGGGVNRHR